jgi:hypothetical protein
MVRFKRLTGSEARRWEQGDPAAVMLALSEPTGLSAADLERLVPDHPPGSCSSCRLPLPAGRTAGQCDWCAELERLAGPAVVSPGMVQDLIRQGQTGEQIAAALNISRRTVDMYAREEL